MRFALAGLALLELQAWTTRWGPRDMDGAPRSGLLDSAERTQASPCLNCSGPPRAPAGMGSPAPCNLSGGFTPEDLNLTDEELKIKYLGPQRHPQFAPICATYLLIFMVGVVGNVLTCTVIARHKTMRTPTNYYLFSLAVSDLLVLLAGLPLELYELWQNYPDLLGTAGCYFRTLLFEMVCLASVLNVTALSVERYVAVVHPLRARSVVTGTHVRRVLAAIWGLAMLCALPNTSLQGIQELEVPCRGTVPDSSWCTVVGAQALYNLLMQVTTLLFFFLPMAVISVLYLLIARQLQRERLLGLQQEAAPGCRAKRPSLQERGRTQVTKMLCAPCGSSNPSRSDPRALPVMLVVVFAVCWAPFHTERLLWSFVSSWTPDVKEAYHYVHIFSGILLYIGSAANPVLYSLMSTRFRETFKDALCLGFRRRRRPARGHAQSLSRVTTGTTLCDLGSTGAKGLCVVENGGPQQNGSLLNDPGSAPLDASEGPTSAPTPSQPDALGPRARFHLEAN